MSDSTTPFDHRPDPVTGAALRAALAPQGGAAFVVRVLAAADRPAIPMVDVLARWSRLGIAAALVAALVVTALVSGSGQPVELATVDSEVGAVIAGVQAPDAATLLASFPDR
ncbi:MAG: hypothetical protein ACREMF_08475 [Gemmatimonadales bacterium]